MWPRQEKIHSSEEDLICCLPKYIGEIYVLSKYYHNSQEKVFKINLMQYLFIRFRLVEAGAGYFHFV